ncbi:MAG TPA: hypothetical protein DCQ98_04405, partial [Planctomycetaceae bacterium]|nr:hypothetical protein [Planctomycetaceae bacterium]
CLPLRGERSKTIAGRFGLTCRTVRRRRGCRDRHDRCAWSFPDRWPMVGRSGNRYSGGRRIRRPKRGRSRRRNRPYSLPLPPGKPVASFGSRTRRPEFVMATVDLSTPLARP